ncbi:hypothetical protein EV137_1616 [Kribbella pratensis]|uniref:Uncharacterized protein n=1 Tax=Kribbella pratensis TaxID=2512112 RepID=A0ABY2FNG9_9ACTN|nr:hypothetical protein EV137_1616 [Kribbella pratensis]
MAARLFEVGSPRLETFREGIVAAPDNDVNASDDQPARHLKVH